MPISMGAVSIPSLAPSRLPPMAALRFTITRCGPGRPDGEPQLQAIVWIAVDWGTSNLRAWGIGADGEVVAEASSDQGMGKLERSGFEPALLDLIGDWLPQGRQTLVIACGMVGARQGWIEVRYRQA